MDYGASTTNQTSGISQALVIELVSKRWGYDGYIRWLRGARTHQTSHELVTEFPAGIGAQYTARRDFMIDCIFESPLVGLVQNRALSLGGTPVYDAYPKSTKSFYHSYDEKFPSGDKPMFSFSIPDSGMFLWVKVHLKYHRDWVPNPAPGSALEQRLWTGKHNNTNTTCSEVSFILQTSLRVVLSLLLGICFLRMRATHPWWNQRRLMRGLNMATCVSLSRVLRYVWHV